MPDDDLSTEELLRGYQNAPRTAHDNEPSTTELLAGYQAAKRPEDVTAGMALRGIPVLGAYVPQAEAAIRAARGQGQGETFGERYANLLPERQAQYAQAERESPITSALLQAGGGTVATLPIAATALGGRALGATGGLLSRTAMGGASGAALSYADALARGEDPYLAAQTGAAIGAAAGPASSLIGRAITPFRGDPARAAAVRTLEQEGVTGLTAGQKTGSWLRYPESSLSDISGAGGNLAERQFSRAVLGRAGIDAEEATPANINRGFRDWGRRADQLEANTNLRASDPLIGHDLGHNLTIRLNDYLQTTAQPARAPENYFAEIMDLINRHGGTVPGRTFRSLTSRMEATAQSAPWDVARILRGMRSDLNHAMEQSSRGTPYEGMWRQLNQQYRDLLTVRDAAGGAGEAAAQGIISPMQLRMAVGRENFARGRSSFDDLIRAGTQVLKPLPQSGTAPRAFWMHTVPGAIGAFGYGAYTGDPWQMAWGGLAGGLGGPLAGHALMHPLTQRYLANRLLAGAPGLSGAGLAPTVAREFQ